VCRDKTMEPKLRNLVWMEIHQRRTQLALCLLWVVGAAVYCLTLALWGRTLLGDYNHISAEDLYAMLMPIFIAMRTSLGEVTDRTRSFSDGLPISIRWRAGVRLAGGAAVLVAPIVLATALLSVAYALGWFGPANAPPPVADSPAGLPDRGSMMALSVLGQLWFTNSVVAFAAVCLYLILSLLGTTLRAESHLGYCGAVAALLWDIGFALGHPIVWREYPAFAALMGALTPQAMLVSFNDAGQRAGAEHVWIYRAVFIPLLASAVIQFGLASMFVRRYSRRLAGRTAERAEPAGRPVSWRPWLPTRGVALAWLAWREALPLCLPGLAIACLLTLFSLDWWRVNQFHSVWQLYADEMPSAMWFMGGFWAVVVGSGLFSPEIDWRNGEFWRTRPIAAWRLFGVKFAAGLLAVLLVLDGSVIAAGWNSPHWGEYKSMSWAYIACIVPLHATMFALAVAWTSVLRRAAVGAVAALLTYVGVGIIVLGSSDATRDFEPVEIYKRLSQQTPRGSIDLTAFHYPVVAAAMTLIIATSMLIGWWALGRYDPRRQAE
ncbi:MAG TPA: hypothetical protein VGG30_07410, partial [Pirellulales bacterium]